MTVATHKSAVAKDAESKNPVLLIQARFKGPGPAAYTLPTSIGAEAKSGGKRAPAYSFGAKLDCDFQRKYLSQTPGPNAFFPQVTRTGRASGPAFSLQGGFKKGADGSLGYNDTPGRETPGPNKYNPAVCVSKDPKGPAYSMGGRRSTLKLNGNPGPAQYNVNPTIGQKSAITIPTSPAYSIKPLRPIKKDFTSPGPAAYSALDTTKFKKAPPAYSLGARWEDGCDLQSPFYTGGAFVKEETTLPKLKKKPTPGPGQYSPGRINSRSTPQFSFRVKHTEFSLFVPDTCEGEFLLS